MSTIYNHKSFKVQRVFLIHLIFFSISKAVHAAPTLDTSGTSQRYRQLLKCVDGLFEELIEKHKEMEKYHIEFKEYAKGENAKLDECDKSENPDE